MNPTGNITVTVGRIGRHTPKGAGAGGREAAILDIAQDLLLRELYQTGALNALVFKGGTALRKLYAGNQGRFSLDLDFSLAARRCAGLGDDVVAGREEAGFVCQPVSGAV